MKFTRRNLKIHHKILFSLGCVLLLLILVAAIGYVGSVRINGYLRNNTESRQKLEALTGLRGAVRNRILETYDFIFVISELDKIEKIKKSEAEVNASLLQIKKVFSSEQDKASLEPLKQSYHAIDKELDELIAVFKSGEIEIGKSVLMGIREKSFNENFMGALNDLVKRAKEQADQSEAELKKGTEIYNELVISVSLLGIVLTAVLAYTLARSIREKLSGLETGARNISDGHFDVAIAISDSDELSLLGESFNKMASALRANKEQLLSQQAMLMANSKMSALGEMAGGVAHEINTPLATIQLLAAQLQYCVKSKNFDEEIFDEALHTIDLTVKRIAQIVSGLRSFSRDSRKDPVTSYSLSKIVEETIALCQDRFKSHGVSLDFKFDGECTILCRPSEISQVLLNLLNNSFDAVENLEAPWIRTEITDEPTHFVLSVEDSGPGITQEIQDKIMQPFFTTKEIGKGTGLGLSISKGLIEGHGGTLVVNSKVPHTCFEIRLPKPK